MSSPEPQLTPMMAQYRRIKGELPKDALLLFRPPKNHSTARRKKRAEGGVVTVRSTGPELAGVLVL